MGLSGLTRLFSPHTLSLIGASEVPGSLACRAMENLLQYPCGATLYPVHPTRSHVFGVQTYPEIGAAPEKIDLALLAAAPEDTPEIVRECVQAGVGAAILLPGDGEGPGPAWLRDERLVRRLLLPGMTRLLGPDSVGVMVPPLGLNATVLQGMAPEGQVALVSQSAGVCSAALDWGLRENVGLSALISLGGLWDLDWPELLRYLAADARTKSIFLYVESLRDTRSFLAASRDAALTKPVVVMKADLPPLLDEVLDAHFLNPGFLQVHHLEDFFAMADFLSKQPPAPGRRLAVLTNAYGAGALAADDLAKEGGCLADLSPATIERLGHLLPGRHPRRNPVDLLGDASADRYAEALEALLADPQNDGVLVILTPRETAPPEAVAERVGSLARSTAKPLLACWMGGSRAARSAPALVQAGVPFFPYPELAVRTFLLAGRLHRLREAACA